MKHHLVTHRIRPLSRILAALVLGATTVGVAAVAGVTVVAAPAVKAVLASGDSNISAFELWNEPDWTWDTSAAGAFDAGWARTFDEVRSLDPSAQIQVPSYSTFNASWMTTFLTDAKASGARPS